jgi:PAS domain S-box-containing protein
LALDGHSIDVLFTIARPEKVDTDSGVILYRLIDITETIRLRREQELESPRLAAIVSSSDDAIISKTLDGKILSWNAGATNILGYKATDMIGQPIFRIIPFELHEEERYILTRLGRGERIHHYETTRVAKDGRRVEISMTLSPLFDKSGTVIGASTVARDITESRQAEVELQRVRTELARVARVTTLGELTAEIAHEVNQPLTGVISSGNACLRWLAGDPPNLEAARRSIQRMIDDGNRASDVISRIRTRPAETGSAHDMVRRSPPRNETLNRGAGFVRTRAEAKWPPDLKVKLPPAPIAQASPPAPAPVAQEAAAPSTPIGGSAAGSAPPAAPMSTPAAPVAETTSPAPGAEQATSTLSPVSAIAPVPTAEVPTSAPVAAEAIPTSSPIPAPPSEPVAANAPAARASMSARLGREESAGEVAPESLAQLRGAWAPSTNDCKRLFQRRGATVAFRQPVDEFAQAATIESQRIRLPTGVCRVERASREGGALRVSGECQDSISYTSEIAYVKLRSTNELVFNTNGDQALSTSMLRCPG